MSIELAVPFTAARRGYGRAQRRQVSEQLISVGALLDRTLPQIGGSERAVAGTDVAGLVPVPAAAAADVGSAVAPFGPARPTTSRRSPAAAAPPRPVGNATSNRQ